MSRKRQKVKLPHPYRFTRKDLLFNLLERMDSTTNPRFTETLLAKIGTPLSKILHLILGRRWLKGGVWRSAEALVPMSDGAKLATTVFLPKKVYQEGGKIPTVLIRTPYWKDSIAFAGHYLALNGYAGVLQDVRGCAHSSPYGSNTFLMSERQDGLETGRWIADQFWYNGKIGMWGASYFGMTQWAVSWDNNDLFTCLNPAISSNFMLWSAHNGLEMNGIKVDFARILHEVTKFKDTISQADFMKETTHRYTEGMLLDPKRALYNDPIDMSNYELHINDLRGKSLAEVTRIFKDKLGIEVPFTERNFQGFYNLINEIMWKRRVNLFSKYMTGMLDYDASKQTTPVLVFAGWYDMFCRVAFQAFCEVADKAQSPAREKSRLIVGPWAHGSVGMPGLNFFGGGFHIFIKELVPTNWFAYWLKDQKDALADVPPIKLYIMGKDRWRYEREWPLKRTRYTNMYFHSTGLANVVEGDGTLTFDAPSGTEHVDAYQFNPLDPVLTRGGNNLHLPKGAIDQRPAEARRDVLVYTSDPLEEGVEVTGNVEVVLYAATSAEDTDFFAKLVDVHPNGKAMNVVDRGVRARYREFDFKHPSLLEPGKVYEYHIPLGPTSNFFQPGHRIRVDVTSSDFPKYDLNSNMGGKGDRGVWQVAHQVIHHSTEFPSHVVLPVIPEK